MKKAISITLALLLAVCLMPVNSLAAELTPGTAVLPQTINCNSNGVSLLKQDGSLWQWGPVYNEDHNIVGHTTPHQTGSGLLSIAIDENASLVVKEDNSLWMWGENTRGVLGTGNDGDSATPVKVLDNVVDISIHFTTVYAVTQDGTLWDWGGGDVFPIFETSAFVTHNKPHKIMEDVVSAACGGSSGVAVKKDGTLWGVGNRKLRAFRVSVHQPKLYGDS